MANKTLTAKVNLNTTQFEQKLRRISRSIDALNNSVKKQQGAYNAVNAALNKNTNATTKLKKETDKVAESANKVHNNFKKSSSVIGALGSKLKSLAATYLGVMGAKAVIGASDTITSAQNKLNNLEGGNPAQTSKTMDKIYAASQRARTGYNDMMSNVSKSMMLAGDAFNNNIDYAIRFQEIMAKSYTVGGASAQEQATSMYQLVQALGSGILAGDELRSVREGAPLAYKAIEKFAQGVYNSTASLKDMASQGLITSDIVVAGIMNAGDEIEAKFKNTSMTFAQAWEMIKTSAIKAFQPVLETLNKTLNSDDGRALIEGIGNTLVILGNTVSWLFSILGSFFNWYADNWYWLQYVVIAVLSACVAALLWKTAVAIAGWIAEQAVMLGILAIIGLLVAGIIWLANTTSSGCEFMCTALLFVVMAILLIGIVTGNVVVMVIGLVLAAVALIVVALANYGEEIMGVIYAVGAFFYNLVVGVVDGVLQYLWTYFVEPFIGIIEWILNVCNGGFDSFGGAVANLIGQIISWFLSLGKVVTKIIDAIFGTNWTDGLNALQDNVLSWGKNEKAITLEHKAPTVQSIAGNIGVDMPNRIAYGDAYGAGAKVGRNIENGIASAGDYLKDKISGFSINGVNGLPNPYDTAYALDPYNTSKALEGIAGNTDDINDKMDLKDEDMAYLRKIAEMEWQNKYTTAEIKVDMTNNNSINSERDWEDILTYFSDRIREESYNLAYGIHD